MHASKRDNSTFALNKSCNGSQLDTDSFKNFNRLSNSGKLITFSLKEILHYLKLNVSNL